MPPSSIDSRRLDTSVPPQTRGDRDQAARGFVGSCAGYRLSLARKRAGVLLCATTLVLSLAQVARAEIYSWVDAEGVVHFTNLPKSGAKTPVSGSTNTYAWRDPTGRDQKLHRLHVTTYDPWLIEAAQHYALPPELVKAVTATESAFEPHAVSHAGAMGLMQLIPSTARAMFVTDPFDPRQNIFGGTRYLRVLANRFNGDIRLTLAAYNAGPEAVERYGDVPPFVETQNYVQRVLAYYVHYRNAAKAASVDATR